MHFSMSIVSSLSHLITALLQYWLIDHLFMSTTQQNLHSKRSQMKTYAIETGRTTDEDEQQMNQINEMFVLSHNNKHLPIQ